MQPTDTKHPVMLRLTGLQMKLDVSLWLDGTERKSINSRQMRESDIGREEGLGCVARIRRVVNEDDNLITTTEKRRAKRPPLTREATFPFKSSASDIPAALKNSLSCFVFG